MLLRGPIQSTVNVTYAVNVFYAVISNVSSSRNLANMLLFNDQLPLEYSQISPFHLSLN